MSIKSKVLATAASLTMVGGMFAVTWAGTPAKAASLSCTTTVSCGGATSLWAGRGSIDLAVQGTDQTINDGFGYWNEHVGFEASNDTSTSYDFTVAQRAGETVGRGGTFGLGDYVAVYTPGGHVPNDPNFPPGSGKWFYNSARPAELAYCVSVFDTYPTVGGHVVQRWSLTLRPCEQAGPWAGERSFVAPLFAAGTGSQAPVVVTNPDPYQVWDPTEVQGPGIEFHNIGLRSAAFTHSFTAGNFVIDVRAWGGPGTWGLAYPENDQANQKFKVNACSLPITAFGSIYWNCVGAVITAKVLGRHSYTLAA